MTKPAKPPVVVDVEHRPSAAAREVLVGLLVDLVDEHRRETKAKVSR